MWRRNKYFLVQLLFLVVKVYRRIWQSDAEIYNFLYNFFCSVEKVKKLCHCVSIFSMWRINKFYFLGITFIVRRKNFSSFMTIRCGNIQLLLLDRKSLEIIYVAIDVYVNIEILHRSLNSINIWFGTGFKILYTRTFSTTFFVR